MWVACLSTLGAACGRAHYQPLDVGPRADANLPGCRWDGTVMFDAPRAITRPGMEGNTVLNPRIDPSGLTLTYIVNGIARTMTRPSTSVDFAGAADFADLASERGRLGGWATRSDGLERYLALGDPTMLGTFNLSRQTRSSGSAPWSPAAELPFGRDPSGDEWDPFLSADGRTLWFQEQRGATGALYQATRATTAAAFASARLVNAPFDTVGNPSVPDGDGALIFSAEGAIYYWRLLDGTPEGAPIVLPELDAPATDYEPSIRADGCEIVWVRQMGPRQEMMHATRVPR